MSTQNDPLVLTGTQSNATQLEVTAHAPQDHPIQTWRIGGGAVAQISQDGRLEVGDQAVASAAQAALIEANQNINSGSTVTQGLQARGIVSGAGAINQPLTWSQHELEVGGTGGVSSTHQAVRSIVTQNNTGSSASAEMRAGSFEVKNNQTLNKAVAVRAEITNASGGNLTEATAFEVVPPSAGTINTFYGLRVPDLTIGTNRYAIHTGLGLVRFGDSVGIGTNPNTKLHLAQESAAVVAQLETVASNARPQLLFRLARGTFATKEILQKGDIVGRVVFGGWDGANYQTLAMIDGFLDEGAFSSDNPGANNIPGAILFRTTPKNSTSPVERMRLCHDGHLKVWNGMTVQGFLNKPGGSFLIDHPLDPENRNLVHSFVEGPKADLIYRGKATLVRGRASVSIDTTNQMTSGTFEALTRHTEAQVWVQNDTGWEPVRGKVVGGTLEIECKDSFSSDTVSWLVVAERADAFIKHSPMTDEDGRLMVEVDKPVPTTEDLSVLQPRIDETATAVSQEPVFTLNGKRGYPMYPEAIGLTQPHREVRPPSRAAQTDEQI